MSLFEEAKAIARAGRPHDAIAFIERAAGSGDPEANVIVAHWLLYGQDRPVDRGAARTHLEAAAKSGSTQAVRILANMTANGTGGDPDREKALAMLEEIAGNDPQAATQLDLLRRAMSLDQAAKLSRTRLASDRHIEVVHGLLSPDERAHLMQSARPSLKPSLIFDAATGEGKPDPIRSSHGTAFLPHDEDLVIQKINRRIARVTGTSVDQGEALYVMRYAPGQQYKPHLDALANVEQQRAWTAIAYLNEDFDGGATVFPELGLSVRVAAGDLLIFSNVHEDGSVDLGMKHSGEPVTGGEKWVATRWIRTGPHDPYRAGLNR